MGLLLLVIRIGLAGILLVSGSAKLLDRAGTRQAYEGFRLPARFAPAVGGLLPIVEIALALTLLPATLVPVSAVLATLLFLAFAIVVTRSVLHDDQVACNCFGQLSAAPVTWRTVARNTLLTVLALAVWIHALATGARSPWGGDLLGVTASLVALGALAWFLHRRTRTDIPAPPSHLPRPLPALLLEPVENAPPDLATLYRQQPLILIVTDPHCRPCTALMPEIARWQREYAPWLSLAVITSGDAGSALDKAHRHGLANLYLQQEMQASDALGTTGTPCAVLVEAGGQLRGQPACGVKAITDLVASLIAARPAAASAPVAPPSRIGQLVPMTRVIDLDGATKFVGGPSAYGQLMVFWDPANPTCQQMLGDLTALATGWPATAPELVVVSRGPAGANRNQGLQSPLVLDEGFAIGRAVGATGTPSAILLNERGRIASALAIGPTALLELAHAQRNATP